MLAAAAEAVVSRSHCDGQVVSAAGAAVAEADIQQADTRLQSVIGIEALVPQGNAGRLQIEGQDV